MAEQVNTTITGEDVKTVAGNIDPTPGSVGLDTQLPGTPTTVSSIASATGGIDAGHFVEPDIDDELFKIKSDDNPLMGLMLKAKKVKVKSPVVDHYMIDEPRSFVSVAEKLTGGSSVDSAVLKLESNDKKMVNPYDTLLAKGIDGYSEDGQTKTPGKDLMLYVVGVDPTTGNPIVRPVNGQKAASANEYSYLPDIAVGTKLVVLSNAMYETQKKVAPDSFIPQPSRIYLQKRGMNRIVSDYLASQKTRIPYAEAVKAEAAIVRFKTRGNRTLWAGRKGKMKVATPETGNQDVYFTEGLRWQFHRELQHSGGWSYQQIIALAKMYFTGEDIPARALILAGKNFLESIQTVDFSKHPEVTITSVKYERLGWSVTNLHTVFGDFMIKREPTLDKLGWSNSAAIIDPERLVHYQRTPEHSFNDEVEGEEAKRSGIIVWDALAMKGSCHVWIDGDGDMSSGAGITNYVMWDSNVAPTSDGLVDGRVYYLLQDCPGINTDAKQGQMWQYKDETWSEYSGYLIAGE